MAMNKSHIEREHKTVEYMIAFYCRKQHEGIQLCSECRELSEYAAQRLEKCPFREDKPTCAKCPVHCYKSEMREKIRKVMRYSGPRMILRHPIWAILHIMDGRRKQTRVKRDKREAL
jgi:hypothetical protein